MILKYTLSFLVACLILSTTFAQGEYVVEYDLDAPEFYKVSNKIDNVAFITPGYNTYNENLSIFYFKSSSPKSGIYGVSVLDGSVKHFIENSQLVAIEYSNTLDKLFAIRTNIGASTKELVTINVNDNSIEAVSGSLGNAGMFQGYDSFSEKDTLYTFLNPPNFLYSIHGVSGNVRYQPQTVLQSGQEIQHFDYHPETGELFAVISKNGGDVVYLARINIETGQITSIGNDHNNLGISVFDGSGTIDVDNNLYVYPYRKAGSYRVVGLTLDQGSIAYNIEVSTDPGDNLVDLEYDNKANKLYSKHWDSVTATDCAGIVNGIAIIDACGVCLEPTDPLFNQSCIDCLGILNGTAVIDDCGECLEPSNPTFNQSCTDCAGVVNGTAEIDDCGECLEPSDSTFNQSCIDCAGVINGTALTDDCGECLEPSNPTFNQSCIDCAGVLNGTSIIDDCGECLEPIDPTFNQSCVDCDGVLNGTSIIDDCGECLVPSDPNFNQSCVDCAGVVNGTALIDDCGECLVPSDPNFNQSCADCAGDVNGTAVIDDCGECLEPSSSTFNQSCADCAGVVNGTAVIDDCGECQEPTSLLFNQSCIDCRGVINGPAVIDDCGECLDPIDPLFDQSCIDCAGVINGSALIDDCEQCLEPTDPTFNVSCNEGIFVPNVFSPAADAPNDRFQLFSTDGGSILIDNFAIFDRWGNLVYHLNNRMLDDVIEWWDGKLQGKDLLQGVYVYHLELTYPSGKKETYQSDVTLMR